MKAIIRDKEIRNEIKVQLAKGKCKQDVFSIIASVYGCTKKIADMVRFIPSAELYKKYKYWNMAYLLLMLIITAGTIKFPSILIPFGIISYGVATKRFEFYWANSVLGFMLLFSIIGFLLTTEINYYDFSEIIIPIVIFTVSIIMILTGIILPTKITPKYRIEKRPFSNKKGDKRLKLVYLFD